MAYVSRNDIENRVPPPMLIDALDDDSDGQEDAGRFDAIVASASTEVDGYLSGLFAVPFPDPAPKKVIAAATVFVLEIIYGRRNMTGEGRDPNPYKSQAAWWRAHLQKVGNREIPFDAATTKAFVPGAAITESVATNAQST